MTKNPREAAAAALVKIEKDGEYSNRALLESVRGTEPRDTALATEIVMGVLRNKIYLDFIIRSYSKIRLKKLSPWVLQILRCGVYQLVMTDKIPPSAACNEAVKLAARYAHSAAKGYVNGVLRTVSRNLDSLPEPTGTKAEVMSTAYSCPLWITEKLIEQFGAEVTASILTDSLIPHLTMLRVNTLKTTPRALCESLEESGIRTEEDVDVPECLRVFGAIDIARLSQYKDGLFTPQNINSMRAALILNPHSGETVMDLCAAPGGKTTHIAELMENRGRVIAFDIHKHKIALIENAANRLGIDIIEAKCADSEKLSEEYIGCADRVLADVPCSGIGVIHKKPDIKYNRRPEDIEQLCKIQEKILENAARYLKDGGVLVYSTCTIFKDENEYQIERFLERHDEFEKEFEKLYLAHETGGSGFYICRMVKNSARV